MKKILLAVSCLLLVGVQAFGQQVTFVSTVPVPTDAYDSFLAANWDKGEVYVSNASSLVVIDAGGWTVKKTIPMALEKRGMCISPDGSLIALTSRYAGLRIVNMADGSIRTLSVGIEEQKGCSFSADGKTLFVSAAFLLSPDRPKIAAVDLLTAKVRTWTVDDCSLPSLQALPNGKVYILAEQLLNRTGNLKILSNGAIKTMDVGMMPNSILVSPGGLAYISGSVMVNGNPKGKTVVIDIETDEIVYEGNIINMGGWYNAFPSQDPWYVLVASGGLRSVNLAQKISGGIIFDDGANSFGIVAHRQADGSDTTLLLREGRVDVFRTVQPPTIYSVASSSSFQPGQISPRGHYTIFGHALTDGQTSYDWLGQQFEMAGALAKVCGIQSRMIFASPSQINFVTPSGITPGQECDVEVKLPLGTATIPKVRVAERDLSLFQFMPAVGGLPYPPPLGIMTTVQGELLGPPGVSATPAVTQPKLGDVIVLWGNGCGVSYPDDQNTPMTGVLMSPLPRITIGGVEAKVEWAGLAPLYVALCQINVRIPSSLPEQSSAVPYQLILEGGASYPLWVAK